MRQAADLFRRAIERDPGYVLAWVGLGDALGLLVSYGHDEPAHGVPRAEEAIRRALELHPESAEAHASLGLLRYLRRRGPETLRSNPRATMALAHAASGDAAAARELLEEEMNPITDPFAAGLVHAALEERDAAFEAFARVGDWGDWPSMAVHGLYSGVWKRLRDDPRYPELLHAVSRSWGMEGGPGA